MILKYKLKSSMVKETSKGKGIARYILVGDQGHEREVSAIATLGKRGIKSVRPIHHREQPLIDVLSKASINEVIEVDFEPYNKKHPRDHSGSREIIARTTKISDPYEDSLIRDISSLKDNKLRILKLVALSILMLTAIMFVKEGFFS